MIGGGENAQGNGHHRRHHQGDDRQGYGDDKPVGDQSGDRDGVGVGGTEVTEEKTADPLEIAQGRRLIETELGAQGSEGVLARLDAKDQQGRVAR